MRNSRIAVVRLLLIVGGLVVGIHQSAHSEPGVFGDKVIFGQSCVLDGPAKALGVNMRAGILAAFEEANTSGGVHGREFILKTYDDGYEPVRAAKNTKRLINEDKVFSLIGGVGTPTSKEAAPIARESGVPFIGPFTGAGFLRRADQFSNVVNVRASYSQEAELWVERMTRDLGISRIAIFYQDDSFGRAGLQAVKEALARRGMKLVARGTYARNLTAVHSALFTIRKAHPEAVVMVGAYRPNATFIRLGKSLGFNPLFINISFVGSMALAEELESDAEGVVVTQVVPFPWDKTIPIVTDCHAALKSCSEPAKPGFVSLEGYIVGRFIIEAMKRIEGEPTRAKLFDAVYKSGVFNLGGVTLNYSHGDNQGADVVHMTIIQKDGTFKPIKRLPSRARKTASR